MNAAETVRRMAEDSRARPTRKTRPPKVPSDPSNPLGARSLDAVDALPVDWLWPNRIPFGILTMLDGDPGLGKSSVAFDLAARLTCGRPMPQSVDPPPDCAGVLLLCAEDSPSHTLRPRLEAAGADLSRVFDLTAPVQIPGDLPAIEALIDKHGIHLVIIDPVMSFLAAGVDSNGDQSSRQALTPLKTMAERTGAAVILVRHLNKKNGDSAAYRGGGSIAFTAVARSALVVGRDPVDPDVFILAPMKCNVGKRPDPVSYEVGERPVTLASGKVVMMPVVEWGDLRPDLAADDICTRPDPKAAAGHARKRDEVRGWLESQLAAGPAPKSDIQTAAERAGFKWRSVERIATELGIVKNRVGFGTGSIWKLPTPAPAHVHRRELAGMDFLGDESPEILEPNHSRHCPEKSVAGMDAGGNGGNDNDALPQRMVFVSDDRPEGCR